MMEIIINVLLLLFIIIGIVVHMKRVNFYRAKIDELQCEAEKQLKLVNMLKERVIGEKPLRKKLKNG